MWWNQRRVLLVAFLVAMSTVHSPADDRFQSHPPQRPLPQPSARPLVDGPAYYVSPQGSDVGDGSRKKPWRTVQHGVDQLQPGDTLYLRGGVYHEHVTVGGRGTATAPITIRGYPGELPILDGGLREFQDSPQSAWEPVAGGAEGEFRSTKTYPELGGRAEATNVLGNFADSMTPLHGYRFITDLRNDNEYFAQLNAGKTDAGGGIYCGPGVYYDLETARIHIRLAHTSQKALGDDNYRGETDPRKVRLVIAGTNPGSALTLRRASSIRVQDLVVRGARVATVAVHDSRNVQFEGVTAYGGSSAMEVRDTTGLRVWHCALRGIAAPWTYRGSLKYRAIEARIFSASGWVPTGADSRDFELAYSEFTDCVDGVFVGNVNNVRFHHNLVDNISDDGIYLTATTAYDGSTPGGNVHIYQNRLSRCLTTFAFGVGHGRQKMTSRGRQTGAGVFIYRNIFDFRQPVMYTQPGAEAAEIESLGRVSGDHGSPLWEPMTIYHNTFLHLDSPWRGYYLSGLGGHMGGGAKRRLFNNLVAQATGPPGGVLPEVVLPAAAAAATTGRPATTNAIDSLLDQPTKKSRRKKTLPDNVAASTPTKPTPPPTDFQADGNLQWSYDSQPTLDSVLGRFRRSPHFTASKSLYADGWTTHDVVADPLLMKFTRDWRVALDCRLRPGSPALSAGVTLPTDWPDPLRMPGGARPDIGAIPRDATPWSVGVRGRLTVLGAEADEPSVRESPAPFAAVSNDKPSSSKSVVVVRGYPAFDAPLIEFALRGSGAQLTSLRQTWLEPSEYHDYDVVVVVGNLARAKIEPNQYNEKDLAQVERFLRDGGTLLLARANTSLFGQPAGRRLLHEITGTGGRTSEPRRVLLPKHDWVAPLAGESPEWINVRHAQAISATKGELIIGHPDGVATLYRVRFGKGQLVYVGWDIAASLPHGRRPSTIAQESAYEQQMQVLTTVLQTLAQ